MAEKIAVPVNAAVLLWARRSASVSLEVAAKAAGVAPDRLELWEAGDETPTLPQLRRLADKYKRPLAVMLLPRPPKDFQALKNFRRTDPEAGAALPPRAALEIRTAYERREIALEMMAEIGTEPRPFKLTASLDDDAEEVGAAIRRYLGVKRADLTTWAKKGDVFNGWRMAAETADILVFVMGGSHGPLVREVRGFAIPNKILPAVAVNARDKTNGRSFTLLHEIAHLLLGEGVIENTVAPDPRMPVAVRRIERWCNAVAAAAMMPRDVVEKLTQHRPKGHAWNSAEIDRLAEALGASREATLLRMVSLGRAARSDYAHRRPAFEAEYEEMDKPSGEKGFAIHHQTMVARYGKPYARLVLTGYRERRITLNDAAAYLGVQAKYVPEVEKQAFRAA